jgi:RimJ/RimL family protein N-acetyltransferase
MVASLSAAAMWRVSGAWEISYQLRHAYWGKWLAGEAVSLVCTWFFENLDEQLLIATTQAANHRSRRLLVRLGAAYAGDFEQYRLAQQRYEFRRPLRGWACPLASGVRMPV